MSFDYKEFIELRNKFVNMDKEFDSFLSNFLLEIALRALAETKRNTPVDTGLLRNSWQIGGINREGDMLEIELYNPIEYASFNEYGHMTRNRDGWVEGKFMCTIAINRIESQIPARFETAFNTWIRSLGM